MKGILKFYIILFLLLIAGVSYMELSKGKEIDWRKHYETNKKSPFGLFVFNKEIDSLFGNQKVQRLKVSPYEYLDAQYDYDSNVRDYKVSGTFLNINHSNSMDDESLEEILTFVSRGNEAFLSWEDIPSLLVDSLHVSTESILLQDSKYHYELEGDSSQQYNTKKEQFAIFFDSIDTTNAEVLGYIVYEQQKRPNFIRICYGDGTIYLHTVPVAFTNYNLLHQKNYLYSAALLNYIWTEGDIFWNTNRYDRDGKADTPLRVVLSYPALKWAWYFFLIGIILYLIFTAKRKQRVVPIIQPLQNTTVEFTKTISNLYYQENNHRDILEKRIVFFLERIRNDYYLETNVLNHHFIKRLGIKSNKPEEKVKQLIDFILQKRKEMYTDEQDLITFNRLLEDFWK